jgi:hypothetical protein
MASRKLKVEQSTYGQNWQDDADPMSARRRTFLRSAHLSEQNFQCKFYCTLPPSGPGRCRTPRAAESNERFVLPAQDKLRRAPRRTHTHHSPPDTSASQPLATSHTAADSRRKRKLLWPHVGKSFHDAHCTATRGLTTQLTAHTAT